MRKVILIAISQIISLSSLVRFFFGLDATARQSWWEWSLFAAAVLAILANVAYELLDHFRNAPKTYRGNDTKRINKFMCKWVNSNGRVVIFSRDMSWAEEPKVRKILSDKAKRKELTVILEKVIPLTEELSEAGAKIIPYEKLGHVPRSRFTIVGFDREGARVAVGASDGDKHVIQVFRSGHDPYFGVAEDLVKFLSKATQS